jgi:hypothetical protein
MNGESAPSSRIRVEEVDGIIILYLDGRAVIRTTDRKWMTELLARLGKDFPEDFSDLRPLT